MAVSEQGQRGPVALTEPAIARARREAEQRGKRIELADKALPGLRLRISPPSRKAPSGRATWVLGCRDKEGRARRFALGDFPGMGVAAAREAARALRPKVRNEGHDPIAERRRARALARDAQAGVGSLRHLLDIYGGPIRPPADGGPMTRVIGPGAALKSWPDARRRIEHVFAAFLDRPLATLRAEDLQLVADAHPAQQSAGAAVRYLRPVLKWAAQRRYCPRDAALIEPPVPVRRRERVLTDDELSAVLPVLRSADDPFRRAALLSLMTLVRRERCLSATWGQVDLEAGRWSVVPKDTRRPGRRAQRPRAPHVVPLPRQAVALLAAIRPEGAQPDALIFATRAGTKVQNVDREMKRLHRATGTADWSFHDLRRTGATLLGRMGVEPHVIEAALDHADVHSRLAGTYNQSRYEPKVAAALQVLADRLDGIAEGAAKVIPLRPPAGAP